MNIGAMSGSASGAGRTVPGCSASEGCCSGCGATSGASSGGAASIEENSGTGGGGGEASGAGVSCAKSVRASSDRMFSHTIGRGSTEPTIWLRTPSR
ncbi:hypothetical protein M2175_007923 [Bradyrhizobium elkanii]|nr:hypothetical protein [Bradyrhizobium elkanii]